MKTYSLEKIFLDNLLQDIVKNKIYLKSDNNDGRINSANLEKNVVEHLRSILQSQINQGFINFEIPKSRSWYDVLISTNDLFKNKYFINIKITQTNQNDNVNCKLGLFYALTGKEPDFANEISWEEYFKLLSSNLNFNNDKDYYFVIINKNNYEDSFWTSLKGLKQLVANGNNLPFQCNWSKNLDNTIKNSEISCQFLLDTLYESLKKRGSALKAYEENFKC